MPQTTGKAQVNNFIGGLVTDAHELNTPQNVTVDEDNCDLDRKGSRKRRLGINYESSYEVIGDLVTVSGLDVTYFKMHTWRAVNNDGSRNFMVLQTGSTLTFFEDSGSALSGAALPFTVNLEDFAILTGDYITNNAVQVTSGKGALFVVGKYINPFYITYDPDTNTIETTQLDLRIRDLNELDTETDNGAREATISDERRYDLLNQGWGAIPPYLYNISPEIGYLDNTTVTALEFYLAARGVYPPKTKPWWVGKRLGDGDHEYFVPDDTYDMIEGGNSLSGLGHFVLDPFNKDRNTASGMTTLEAEVLQTRPTAVRFYSGRVFYGFENLLFFSKVLTDNLDEAALCYQSADPTAEHDSDLVATDGGTLRIPESGTITTFAIQGGSLLVFSENGVWAVGGVTPGDGFSATAHSVQKISAVGMSSFRSLVSVEGTPVWWAPEGIFTIVGTNQPGGYETKNLLQNKIQLFYDDIPAVSRDYASGVYDRRKKVITWIFNSTSNVLHNNRFICNRMLNYDTLLEAWYPYTLSDLETNTPAIVDVFAMQETVRSTATENVWDNVGQQVTDNSGNTYIDVTSVATSPTTVGVKFVTVLIED